MNMRRVLLFLPIALAILLGVFLWKGLSMDPRELPSALIGKPFPAFTLNALQPSDRQLTKADFPNQPFLVNVWATWCPSCKTEHPQLVSIARNDGIPIVGLNYKDTAPEAMNWLRQYQNPYVYNIFDPEGTLGFNLGVYGAPETYIIDAQGIVRYRHAGPIDIETWKVMRNIVRDLERQG